MSEERSTDTNPDVVERARAVLEGVTPTPWVLSQPDGNWISPHVCNTYGHNRADAEFIAAARSLVPELVAEVERVRQLKPRLEAFGRDFVTHGDMTPAAKRILDQILTLGFS